VPEPGRIEQVAMSVESPPVPAGARPACTDTAETHAMTHATHDWLVGRTAPPLDLPTREADDRISLEALRGRSVLVTFLSHAA